jgi:hypothetical protein
MGCSSLAAHSGNIHKPRHSLPHFTQDITAQFNTFTPKYVKFTGTERVNRIKDFKVLLDSKGLNQQFPPSSETYIVCKDGYGFSLALLLI